MKKQGPLVQELVVQGRRGSVRISDMVSRPIMCKRWSEEIHSAHMGARKKSRVCVVDLAHWWRSSVVLGTKMSVRLTHVAESAASLATSVVQNSAWLLVLSPHVDPQARQAARLLKRLGYPMVTFDVEKCVSSLGTVSTRRMHDQLYKFLSPSYQLSYYTRDVILGCALPSKALVSILEGMPQMRSRRSDSGNLRQLWVALQVSVPLQSYYSLQQQYKLVSASGGNLDVLMSALNDMEDGPQIDFEPIRRAYEAEFRVHTDPILSKENLIEIRKLLAGQLMDLKAFGSVRPLSLNDVLNGGLIIPLCDAVAIARVCEEDPPTCTWLDANSITYSRTTLNKSEEFE